MLRNLWNIIPIVLLVVSCGYNSFELNKDQTLEPEDGDTGLVPNITIAELEVTANIQQDVVLKAVVQSCDSALNFSRELFVADTQNPTPRGLCIDIGIRDIYTYYAKGDTVLIRLKDFAIVESTYGVLCARYRGETLYSVSTMMGVIINSGSGGGGGFVPLEYSGVESVEDILGIAVELQGVSFLFSQESFGGYRRFSFSGQATSFNYLYTLTTSLFAYDYLPVGVVSMCVIPVYVDGVVVFRLASLSDVY